MKARKLTASDACEVTGYTRDQLKALLRDLPAWGPPPRARAAREFSPHDLIVLGVVHVLDSRISLRRRQIGLMLPKLRQALLGPREVTRSPRLAISFDPLSVEYLSGRMPSARDGLLISLGPIFDRVDYYLGATQSRKTFQKNLPLPPEPVRSRRRRVGEQTK
jgi:hypothetical protein